MIKMDIVAGFLGAGKTTLINRYLDALKGSGEKVVLIENDFGKIGVDKSLIRGDNIDIYEINQGCLCCNLKSNFILALNEIAKEIGPSRVIIEPSGLVLLGEVFDFFTYPQIEDAYVLNQVITVVDAVNYDEEKKKFDLLYNHQLENAYKLICSKTELVPLEQIYRIVEELAVLYPRYTVMARDWESLSDDELYAFFNDGKTLPHPHIDVEEQREARRIHGFSSFSLVPTRTFDRHSLALALADLAARDGSNIVRAKGFFRGEIGYWELQYVNGKYEIRLHRDESLEPMACFIGHELERDAIEAAFA